MVTDYSTPIRTALRDIEAALVRIEALGIDVAKIRQAKNNLAYHLDGRNG